MVRRCGPMGRSSNNVLLASHRAQLHTLLGLYAMSMNCMETIVCSYEFLNRSFFC